MMEPKRVAVNGITTQTGESKPVTVTRKLISILLAMVLAAGVLVVMPLGALGAEKIALNSPKSVTLSGGNYAEFSFTPTRTSSYKLESTGSYDTKAELYLASNIDGYFISIDDDGGSGTNFALTYTLQAGIEYVYRVFFYSSSTSGSFSITLSEIHSHNYGAWLITTNATCVATGIRTRKCTICGAEETENVNSTGHTWNAWITTKSATCTATGIRTRTCTKDNTHTETETIAAKGHNVGSWKTTKAATCTKAGKKAQSCKTCDKAIYSETLYALGHNFGNWKVTAKGTCKVNGIEARTCKRKDCTKVEKRSVKTKGVHVYGGKGTVTKSPTIKATGVRTYKCKTCDKTKKETIPQKKLTQNGFEALLKKVDGKWVATITAYTGSAKNVYFPQRIGGYPVTAMERFAFDYAQKPIDVLAFPYGWEEVSIGNASYYSSVRVNKLALPNSVYEIEKNNNEYMITLSNRYETYSYRYITGYTTYYSYGSPAGTYANYSTVTQKLNYPSAIVAYKNSYADKTAKKIKRPVNSSYSGGPSELSTKNTSLTGNKSAKFNKSKLTMDKGSSKNLAFGNFTSSSNKIAAVGMCRITSSNNSIVAVGERQYSSSSSTWCGKVKLTAKKKGTATITLTTGDGKKYKCKVTVK